jgi:hypothetical protein
LGVRLAKGRRNLNQILTKVSYADRRPCGERAMRMKEIEVRHVIWKAITNGRDDKGQPIARDVPLASEIATDVLNTLKENGLLKLDD